MLVLLLLLYLYIISLYFIIIFIIFYFYFFSLSFLVTLFMLPLLKLSEVLFGFQFLSFLCMKKSFVSLTCPFKMFLFCLYIYIYISYYYYVYINIFHGSICTILKNLAIHFHIEAMYFHIPSKRSCFDCQPCTASSPQDALEARRYFADPCWSVLSGQETTLDTYFG